jgi:hypothetical protein
MTAYAMPHKAYYFNISTQNKSQLDLWYAELTMQTGTTEFDRRAEATKDWKML